MINHIRTVLLNTSTAQKGASDLVGEEYVSSELAPSSQPAGVAVLRGILFGHNPDRHMLNYRLAQFMPLLHTTELEEFVLDKDPRITYWPSSTAATGPSFYDETFGTTITSTVSTGAILSTVTEPVPSRDGQLFDSYAVEVASGTTLSVTRKTKPFDSTTVSFAVTDGLSDHIALPGTQVLFTVSNPQVGDSWDVEILRRPDIDLGVLPERISRSAGVSALTDIFGTASAEPYKTFKNLWEQSDVLSYKLGGLLLALAYRMDEPR